MGDTNGCVLFADVSGSTKLYETIGDAAAHQPIDLCVQLLTPIQKMDCRQLYSIPVKGKEREVWREETLLRGHGFITLGQSRATATEFVEYFCE